MPVLLIAAGPRSQEWAWNGHGNGRLGVSKGGLEKSTSLCVCEEILPRYLDIKLT